MDQDTRRVVGDRAQRSVQLAWGVGASLLATIGLLAAFVVWNNRGDADGLHSTLACALYTVVGLGLWAASCAVCRATGMRRSAAWERGTMLAVFVVLFGGPVGFAVFIVLTFDSS